MKKTNILVIDKDVLVRQAVAHVLLSEPSFRIAAISGKVDEADKQIATKHPDVVLLNVDSTDSEGLEVLNLLRARFPEMPLVVLSPRTREGAPAAIKALQLGAVDVVTKPEYSNSVLFAGRHFKKRLIPIVKAAADLGRSGRLASMKPEAYFNLPPLSMRREMHSERDSSGSIQLVVMGGCTGGLQALFSIIPKLPADLSVPVVVVQHFPQKYTFVLAEKLDEQSAVHVRETRDGAELVPGVVWIAAGGYHSEIVRDGSKKVIRIHRGLRESNNRPSVDTLFRSAGSLYGPETMGVMLSGCGTDGLNGAEVIKKAGGQIIVQDPRTALVPEMPLSLINAGLTHEFYSSGEMASQIVERVLERADTETFKKKMRIGDTNSRYRQSRIQNDLFV